MGIGLERPQLEGLCVRRLRVAVRTEGEREVAVEARLPGEKAEASRRGVGLPLVVLTR